MPPADITLVTASDNCGTPVVTWEGDVWNGTCPRIITRTYMATDSCGNTTTCVQTITVDDIMVPRLRVCDEDVPLPYAANLEKFALITPAEVVTAVKSVCYR